MMFGAEPYRGPSYIYVEPSPNAPGQPWVFTIAHKGTRFFGPVQVIAAAGGLLGRQVVLDGVNIYPEPSVREPLGTSQVKVSCNAFEMPYQKDDLQKWLFTFNYPNGQGEQRIQLMKKEGSDEWLMATMVVTRNLAGYAEVVYSCRDNGMPLDDTWRPEGYACQVDMITPQYLR